MVILALNMVLPLPHEQYGDTLYFSSVVDGHHIRPLGEILSIYETPEQLHVLENVSGANINKVVSSKMILSELYL